MKKILYSLLAIGMLFMASAQAALITQFNVNYYSDYTVSMVAQGYSHYNYVGAFSAVRTGGDALPSNYSNPFVTFCLDINNTLANGYWTAQNFAEVQSSTSGAIRHSDRLDDVARLYNTYSTGILNSDGSWANKQDGAALQLALWEVLYENTENYNVRTGNGFYVVGSGNSSVMDRANYMLNSLDNLTASSEGTFWNASYADGSSRNSQDLIGPVSNVPEPGSILVSLMVLLPLGFSAFKRK